nr:uncharacterized protein At2g29880-like isoform X2 [Ipomoea trifida]
MLSEKLESIGDRISKSLGTELTLQQKIEQLEGKLIEIEGLPYDDKFKALIKLPGYPKNLPLQKKRASWRFITNSTSGNKTALVTVFVVTQCSRGGTPKALMQNWEYCSRLKGDGSNMESLPFTMGNTISLQVYTPKL